jgi:hypothetical protein
MRVAATIALAGASHGALLDHALRGSTGVDPAVTAYLLAELPDLELALSSTGRTGPLQCEACALVANLGSRRKSAETPASLGSR